MVTISVVFRMFSVQVLEIVFMIVMIGMVIISATDAAYKRPPFNGSMFGKRNSIGKYFVLLRLFIKIILFIIEYANTEKSFEAICEIAFEACQNILSQENMK